MPGMRLLSLPFLHRFRDVGPLVLRLVLGIIFIAHGWPKLLAGPAGIAPGIGRMGLPLSTAVAAAVILLEVGGSVLLIMGLLTRLTGLLFSLEMLGTSLLVKANLGLIAPRGSGAGAELDLALLAGSLTLVLLGPGAFSLDQLVGIEQRLR